MRVLLLLFIFLSLGFSDNPKLFLLKKYKEDMNITSWLMSEKLDGIRAYWNGKELLTRKGNKIYAPKWFTKDFPKFEIDGELWTKRDDFENISSIVRRKNPDKRWKDITYNIFEVPNQKGNLLQRLQILKKYLKTNPNEFIKIIPQIKCKDKIDLNSFLEKVLDKKGEGVVLRNPSVSYENSRTLNALKVKKYFDDECVINGYNYNKKGLLASYNCRFREKVIKIGSGLDNNHRKAPLGIGEVITFKYYGFTKNGVVKFPVYLRVRK